MTSRPMPTRCMNISIAGSTFRSQPAGSHLHVQDDLIVSLDVGLEGLTGWGVEEVKANPWVGVHHGW